MRRRCGRTSAPSPSSMAREAVAAMAMAPDMIPSEMITAGAIRQSMESANIQNGTHLEALRGVGYGGRSDYTRSPSNPPQTAPERTKRAFCEEGRE